MFDNKKMQCLKGNSAQLICICQTCDAMSFVCSKTCACFAPHKDTCSLKNIRELSNGIESLLRRNFCKAFKGEGIEIVARVARQTKPAPRNTRYCLTYCQADSKHDMEFKINTLKTCIGVGVLHKPTIIRNMYQFIPDQSYINHGGYMLLSNGYQYSHTLPQQNFKQVQGFKFAQGSTIRLSIEKNILLIEQKQRQIKLTLPQESDLYYGIYLYDEGDEIQVLVKE